MDNAQAARNRLVTALSVAIAETAGHKGQLQKPDRDHAVAIAKEIEDMVKLYASGEPDGHYA